MFRRMQFDKVFNQMNTNTVDIKKNVQEETQIWPIIQESLKKIVKNEKYMSYEVFNNSLSAEGKHLHLGNIVEIDIKGEKQDGFKETNIFIKSIIPKESMFNGMVNVKNSFTNEVIVYSEMLQVFDELYNEVGVPKSERLRTVKAYDYNNYLIVLENMSRQGFKTLDRMDLIPLNFAVNCMTQLARLHALSFALENKKPDIFEKLDTKIKSVYNFDIESGLAAWKKYIDIIVNSSFQYINDNYQDKKKYLLENIDKIRLYLIGEIGSVRCLCHGDFKLNNVLMKQNVGGETETIIIDYQFTVYNTPVTDILFFLYSGSNRKFRQDHMDSLKDIYHRTLSKSLNDLELDVNKIYPRSVFEKDFQAYSEFGLMVSLTILATYFTDNVEFFEGDMSCKPKINDRFKKRINGAMQEYIENGIL